ncbi:WD40 repeat-like protein [Scenedesmus sp. NREL 46B-D3]|nr:WD40 repeat-like protein [Scenedesmus sp. NREL 46B-D3]
MTKMRSQQQWRQQRLGDREGEDMDVESAVAKARAAAEAISANSGKAAAKPSSQSKAAAGTLEAALAELDMDNYDDSDEEAAAADLADDPDAPCPAVIARALGGRSAGLILDDPYMAAAGGDSEDEDGGVAGLAGMDSEEVDDYTLRDSDLLVWVYEEASSSTGGEANIYVHHDILLPAFPLALAWMDCNPRSSGSGSTTGNMVAIGSMDPGIEVWDLDVADAVEPAAVLGGVQPAAEAAQAAAAVGGNHADAVLGLSWNRQYRNVLASASADGTVKVWDVAAQKCEHTLGHHSGKVQAVAWNPAESPVLLTGSFDRTAALVDVRSPTAAALVWGVSADVEALAWNPGSPTCFLVSSEDGIVAAFDARTGAGSKPLFRLAAHDKPTCALSFCAAAPGLLATASTDKMVKLWDVAENKPKLLASKEPTLGAIFSAGFCADVPYLLAMAGSKGAVGVWDVRSSSEVAAKFPQLLQDVAL